MASPWQKLRFVPGAIRLGAAIAATALGGCRATYSSLGTSQVRAEYSSGSLTADLPEGVRVPGLIAAADASLRRSGYSVGTSRATAEEGQVRGTPPASDGSRPVVVSARTIDDGTRVKVKVGSWGDEAQSRAILEDIIRRLGL